ncbi:hypothetical protein VWI13_03310 [Escherichia coli O157]|nr:hypothetical protein [Escherichia coli O157]
MKSLAEIRAHLKAEQEKAEAQKNGTFTGERKADSFLAFWNVPYNEPLNLRFLPDADESNPFFWRERDMINLTFNGVVGMHTDKVTVQVPCNEMWVPKSCPVLKEVRQWFQSANETGNEELKAMAGRYWKKKTYLMQCFIAPDSVAVKDDIAPENPIRRILANKDIFDKVKSILLNPGIKESPTHYVQGRDFGIVKTKNGGGYNSYDMSQFSMSERPLNEEELAAIEKYGLYNLNDFMPKQPTPEELKAIEEMFEASVNGEAYDPARWAFAYRPAGVPKPNSGTVTESKPTPAPVQQESAPAPVAPTAPVTPAPQAAPVTPVATPAVTTPEAPKEQLSASALVARLKQQGK